MQPATLLNVLFRCCSKDQCLLQAEINSPRWAEHIWSGDLLKWNKIQYCPVLLSVRKSGCPSLSTPSYFAPGFRYGRVVSEELMCLLIRGWQWRVLRCQGGELCNRDSPKVTMQTATQALLQWASCSVQRAHSPYFHALEEPQDFSSWLIILKVTASLLTAQLVLQARGSES